VRLIDESSVTPTIVVELFQDLCCPFSRKVSKTISSEGGVIDRIKSDGALTSAGVEIVFHNVPQPWHPQSPVMHEAMFAVSCAVGHRDDLVHQYIRAAYDEFYSFTDLKMIKDKTRRDIHVMCADIAARTLGDDLGGAEVFKAKVLSFLDSSHLTVEEPHMALGEVTKLLKFAIKYHRLRGVHVTPTVFINGVEAPDVSSGWTADQWMEKLHSVRGS